MGLSKEEKATLEALTAKAKEPDTPSGNVSFSLDLSNDSAWERAKNLGLVRDPEPEAGGDDDDKGEETPRRPGYFGKQQQ